MLKNILFLIVGIVVLALFVEILNGGETNIVTEITSDLFERTGEITKDAMDSVGDAVSATGNAVQNSAEGINERATQTSEQIDGPDHSAEDEVSKEVAEESPPGE